MCDDPALTMAGAKATGNARLSRCRAALWNEQARALVVADRRPRQVLDALVEADHLADAIRFFAMALPKRLSVWWGSLCAWSAYGAELPGDDLAALEATMLWLREPSEANRRAAETMGNKVSVRTPAGALAIAAFMSGGSISRPNLPFVPPGAQATGRLVAGAILLSAVWREPLPYRERYRQYLAMGSDVADGRLAWLAAAPAPTDDVTFRVDPPQSSAPAPHFSVGHPHHHASQTDANATAQAHVCQGSASRAGNQSSL